MSQQNPTSRGASLADRLWRGRIQAASALRSGARDLPVLHGVTTATQYTEPAENVLARGRELLIDSHSVFQYGNSIVLKDPDRTDGQLITIVNDHRPEQYASAVLANIFICESASADEESQPRQYAPPAAFVSHLLNGFQITDSLPRINLLLNRPAYDNNFLLCGTGWHPSCGIYVQGREIEPIVPQIRPSSGTVLDRCPPRLRGLLGEFCFLSDADRANYLAILLTGLLANHFQQTGKPVIMLDGNQPELGKTLLARLIGVLLDEIDPRLITYTPNDEELAKTICGHLRGGPPAVLIFDNARNASGSAINSPVIEAQSMAPIVSLRILGQSANISTPNVMLWIVTMNDTKASPDLVSRGLAIRLHYDGQPENRSFTLKDPIAYAKEHRSEILGELLGMVERWILAGRPRGQQQHRCHYWAETIGGILGANGISEFLANRDEAAAEFDIGRDQLSALAEVVIAQQGPFIEVPTQDLRDMTVSTIANPVQSQPASEWVHYFALARVEHDQLEGRAGQKAKSTVCGKFLSRNVGRRVQIDVGGRLGTAELCHVEGRSRQRRYYFRVAWEVDSAPTNGGVIPPTCPMAAVSLPGPERAPASTSLLPANTPLADSINGEPW